jgi:hypothetical protein
MARDAAALIDALGLEHVDVAPPFGRVYDPQDLVWAPIFLSPSEASQAAGRRSAGEWGAARPGSYEFVDR